MKNIRKFFTESISLFLVGAVLGAGVDAILSNIAQRQVGILISITSLSILYVIVTMQKTQNRIHEQLDELEITALLLDPDRVYDRIAEIIHTAKNSILAINPYVAETPPSRMPEKRPIYFEAIEQVIKKRLEVQAGSPFIYKRVFQGKGAEKTNKLLTKEFLKENPSQSYDHCATVLDMINAKRTSEVDVMFYASEPFSSIPSMVIIDDNFVAIALIAPNQRFSETNMSFELTGALLLEDRSHKKVALFKRVFEKAIENSYPINVLERDNKVS